MHQFIYGKYDPIIYRVENTSTCGARLLRINIVSSITQNLEVFSEVKAALVWWGGTKNQFNKWGEKITPMILWQ